MTNSLPEAVEVPIPKLPLRPIWSQTGMYSAQKLLFFRMKPKLPFSLPRDTLSPFRGMVWVGRNIKAHPAPAPVWYLHDSGASALCGVMGATRQ